jgi:type II restriction enzyme
MINPSFQKELLQINNEWKSNSRIYGEVVELWVQNNIPCKCGGKLITQPANQKSIDSVCSKCSKNFQIKSSAKPFSINKNNKLKILGAEYTTTLNSIKSEVEWDLMLVQYDKDLNTVLDIKVIEAKNIKSENVIPRKPLGPNARRAGWQGCYLEFDAEVMHLII